MDYSKLSDADLKALYNEDYASMSDEGLKLLYSDETENNENIADVQPEKKKGIDLTPSGLINTVADFSADVLSAPVLALKYKTSLKEGFDKTREIQAPENKVQDFLTDMVVYGLMPASRIGKAGSLLNRGITGAEQAGIVGLLEGLKEGKNPLQTTLSSGAVGAGLNVGLPPVINKAGQGIQKVIENQQVQNTVAKILEGLTSVPSKFSKLALDKEIKGQSIFNGKFDAEKAYRPIEAELRRAKSYLPTKESFADSYYKLGQKATQGIEKLKQQYGSELADVLQKIEGQEIKNGGIQNAVSGIINNFGKGGVYNSALEEAPGIVNYLEDNLSKEGLTLMDLHRIKNRLYDLGYAASKNREGTAADVARGAAEQINNYLRSTAKGYDRPNDILSIIHDLERGIGGETTIGGQLSKYGSPEQIESGLAGRLKQINDILPLKDQFIKDTKNLIDSQNEIDNIKNLIGKSYERNPRLLSNRTDEAFENALEDLQTKSGVNFMDELETTRAREALEKLFPGQGGGSGSSQGFGNLLRTAIVGGTPATAVLTHNPLALTGLATISPKIMGKGTIKNIGKAYNKALEMADVKDVKKIIPLVSKMSAPILYGGISNVEE